MDDTLELTRELISRQSVTPEDDGCQALMMERLRNIGERLNIADEVIRLVDPGSLEIVARAPWRDCRGCSAPWPRPTGERGKPRQDSR